MTSAAATAVVKSAGEARPLEVTQHCAATESELAVSSESSDETGLPGPEQSVIWSTAEMAAVAKSVGEARPLDTAKYSDTSAATTVAELVGGARPPECPRLSTQRSQSLLMKFGFLRLRCSVLAEMAPKDHVSEPAEIAPQDHVSEPVDLLGPVSVA